MFLFLPLSLKIGRGTPYWFFNDWGDANNIQKITHPARLQTRHLEKHVFILLVALGGVIYSSCWYKINCREVPIPWYEFPPFPKLSIAYRVLRYVILGWEIWGEHRHGHLSLSLSLYSSPSLLCCFFRNIHLTPFFFGMGILPDQFIHFLLPFQCLYFPSFSYTLCFCVW